MAGRWMSPARRATWASTMRRSTGSRPTIPADQIVATGVTAHDPESLQDGWATSPYVHGPHASSRFMMSPRFQDRRRKTLRDCACAPTSCRRTRRPGARRCTTASRRWQVYSDQFGRYPYREMAIVEAPLTFHGMEFPGISLIGSQITASPAGSGEPGGARGGAPVVVQPGGQRSGQARGWTRGWPSRACTTITGALRRAGGERLRADRWEVPILYASDRDRPAHRPAGGYYGAGL